MGMASKAAIRLERHKARMTELLESNPKMTSLEASKQAFDEIMSLPYWVRQAEAAIAQGQTETLFLASVHTDNRKLARKAFRQAKRENHG
jgi:hypothetical protein